MKVNFVPRAVPLKKMGKSPGDEVVVKVRIIALFCPTFITSPLVFCKKVHLIKEIVFAFNIKIRRRSYK